MIVRSSGSLFQTWCRIDHFVKSELAHSDPVGTGPDRCNSRSDYRSVFERAGFASCRDRGTGPIDWTCVWRGSDWKQLQNRIKRNRVQINSHVAHIFGAHHSSSMDPQADKSRVGQLLAGDRTARHEEIIRKVGIHHSEWRMSDMLVMWNKWKAILN